MSPLNTLFDAFVVNGKSHGQEMYVLRDWDSETLQHAVYVDGTAKTTAPADRGAAISPSDISWSCEIAVPFKDLLTAPNIPPKAGDVWRMNLYRIDRGKTEAEDEYTAWSPTRKIDYHRPQHFGSLQFVDA